METKHIRSPNVSKYDIFSQNAEGEWTVICKIPNEFAPGINDHDPVLDLPQGLIHRVTSERLAMSIKLKG